VPNAFYDPGQERSAKVDQLFTTIAPRYDLINDLQSFGLHRIWKRRVVKMAGACRGVQALDVCCGTGDIAILLAREGAEVVGLDFNERMLGVAARRGATEASHSDEARNPKFLRGDAQQLAFEDNSFDIVTVGYGLRNLASWQTGVAEMARVAGPGGRIVVLEFGKPDNPLWRAFYFAYLRVFVPVLGWMFCGNAGAYAYILESLKHYPAQRGVEAKMRELGLVNVRIINLFGGVMSINYGERPIDS
jgi:demethylmenaquinone methyltransferase/2-methoxy-6-polyprenyl-1,4-benzoquinol methylase